VPRPIQNNNQPLVGQVGIDGSTLIYAEHGVKAYVIGTGRIQISIEDQAGPKGTRGLVTLDASALERIAAAWLVWRERIYWVKGCDKCGIQNWCVCGHEPDPDFSTEGVES
jgi:hypothetical protein